jgi:hypothetical protein
MTIPDQGIKEFQKELEKLIQQMVQKGLLPALSLDKIQDLAMRVTKRLNEDKQVNLSIQDLKNNPDTQKSMGLACMAECNPSNKFNYEMLFKNQFNLDEKNRDNLELDLKNQLKNAFRDMLKLSPKYKESSKEEQEEINQQFDDLAEKLTQKFLRDDLSENKQAFNLLSACEDLLSRPELYRANTDEDSSSDYRRQLYGVDTHVTGAVFKPVLAEPIGDQIGVLNLSSGEGNSFEAEKMKPDVGAPDPLSIKFSSILLEAAADELCPEIESALKSEGLIYDTTPKNVMKLD